MDLSRREYCLITLAGVLGPGSYLAAKPRPQERGAGDGHFADYQSTLVDGLTPGHIAWNGHKWRCAMGSTWHPGMDHSLRLTRTRARFEIRESSFDRGRGDPPEKRRSELRIPKSPRLPNYVPLWGAMSFIHHQWEDPDGMARAWGGVHGQMHIGSDFGGSPAFAFRRNRQGRFMITTRGENDRKGTRRYEAPLAFDRLHHLVYRVILGPKDAALAVWLNGDAILDLKNASIGSSEARCYWGLGCYYPGGTTCPIVAEYGDHIYPGVANLSRRIGFRPNWGRQT